MTPLDALSDAFLEARDTRDRVEAVYAEAQRLLIEAIEAAGGRSHEHVAGDIRRVLTIVRGNHTEVDEAALERGLPIEMWETITRRRVERELLDAAVKLGQLPKRLVSRALTTKPKRPWVKVTPKAVTPKAA